MKKIFLIAFIISYLCNPLLSQVTFKASANSVVEIGENFRLNYTVNANGSGFVPPDLSNFSVLAGPSTSTSTSFQYINGKTSQAISNTYSYVIQAGKEGKFTVGPASITVEGTTYKSNSLVIEVIKGNASSNNLQSTNSDPSTKNIAGDIFAQINLSKTTVYQGEQLVASLKVYDRMGLSSLNDYKFPSYTGFWTQDIEGPARITPERENVNNKIYTTFTLRRSILFPQKSGQITIEPFEVEGVVQVKAGQRRDFFGRIVDVYQDASKTIKSSPRTIKVLPLPENKPASFNGAVGTDFKFNVDVDRTELKSNESLTLKVTVSGNGNLQIIDKIKLDFPASFEVFDPKVTSNINNSVAGARGSKTYEYLIVPREPGDYTIPALEFSYFDVNSKSYKTLKYNKMEFKIAKGDNNPLYTSDPSLSKEAVQSIGSDIRFIVQDGITLKRKNHSFFGSFSFYIFYIVSIVLFFAVIFILRKRIKLNQNLVLQKNKRANKISQKRLREAAKHMKSGNKSAFYDEVIRALWGYLSDKLNIPVADLSRETVKETLNSRNIDQEIVNNFVEVIDNCEFAKYAPSSNENQIEQDYDKARKIINKLVNALS
ncbi:MAG: BatD family protein [Bacteroidales bacterium]|nr:BatD family protein [Bacteroidales bacterium]